MRESAVNILQEQVNIVYEPIDSNIIFIGKRKPSNSFKVLHNVANSKVESQTDSCFPYKQLKSCSHTVAAVQLKIFENYISKINSSSTKYFVDNMIDINQNPNAGQKKNKSTQKSKGKANNKPEKVMRHVNSLWLSS